MRRGFLGAAERVAGLASDGVEVRHEVRVLMCAPDGPRIRTDRDAVDVIASSIEQQATFVVIPVERRAPIELDVADPRTSRSMRYFS